MPRSTVNTSLDKMNMLNCRRFKHVKSAVALFTLEIISNLVYASTPIYGTYIVRYERTCVKGPARSTPTPSFFSFSTPDNVANGYVQVPPGYSQVDASNAIYKTSESGKYILVVNPTNNTTTSSNGVYHEFPDKPYYTQPVSVADFGTFSGSGNFTYVETNPFIDVNGTSTALNADGVGLTTTSNTVNRFRTQDGGATFFAITGRGSIRLSYQTPSNTYRDSHCTGFVAGTRISTSY
jgi:type II secretory pathway pseudopilin PulG